MKTRGFALSLVLVALAVAGVVAQPGGQPATTTTATTDTSAAAASGVQQSLQEILEEPAAGEAYRYDPQGRRDPFQSLVGPAPKLQPKRCRIGAEKEAIGDRESLVVSRQSSEDDASAALREVPRLCSGSR